MSSTNRYFNVQRRKKPSGRYYRVPQKGSAMRVGSALGLGRSRGGNRGGTRIARSLALTRTNYPGQTEVKYADWNNQFAMDNIFGSNLGVTLLNGVGQGTSNTQRIGHVVNQHSIRVKWNLILGSMSSSCTCRIAVVYDDHPDGGSLPTYANVFQDQATGASTTGVLSSSILSSLAMTNNDRFRILRDKTFVLMPTASPAGGVVTVDDNGHNSSYLHGDWYIPLTGLTSTYMLSTTGGSVSDMRSGAIYLLFYNDYYSQVSNKATINVCARFRFRD